SSCLPSAHSGARSPRECPIGRIPAPRVSRSDSYGGYVRLSFAVDDGEVQVAVVCLEREELASLGCSSLPANDQSQIQLPPPIACVNEAIELGAYAGR